MLQVKGGTGIDDVVMHAGARNGDARAGEAVNRMGMSAVERS